MKRKVSVLASGGIDSTVTVAFYLDQKYDVECIHFEYGQPNAKTELESFNKICRHFAVEGKVINLGFKPKSREFESVCRNALLLFAGASINLGVDVALGIHAGSPYYDCTPGFVRDCQRLLDGYFGGTTRIRAPFLGIPKKKIVEYGRNHNAPLHLTYSCQTKNDPPCGRCPSCLERELALRW